MTESKETNISTAFNLGLSCNSFLINQLYVIIFDMNYQSVCFKGRIHPEGKLNRQTAQPPLVKSDKNKCHNDKGRLRNMENSSVGQAEMRYPCQLIPYKVLNWSKMSRSAITIYRYHHDSQLTPNSKAVTGQARLRCLCLEGIMLL